MLRAIHALPGASRMHGMHTHTHMDMDMSMSIDLGHLVERQQMHMRICMQSFLSTA